MICSGWDEHEGANGIETQTEKYATLIAVFSDKKCCGDGHGGVAAIEGELYQRGFGGRELHEGLEGRYHGIGDVVGEAPQCKQGGDKDEWDEILLLYEFWGLLIHGIETFMCSICKCNVKD